MRYSDVLYFQLILHEDVWLGHFNLELMLCGILGSLEGESQHGGDRTEDVTTQTSQLTAL